MKLHLETRRQTDPNVEGHFGFADVDDTVAEISILELFDHVNSKHTESGKEPFVPASDRRKGICGTYGLNANGRPHDLGQNTPTYQQHLHQFNDDDTLKIEPIHSVAYSVIKDMVVDRSALDRVLEQGDCVSTSAGTAPDANTLHLNRETTELALDHAACIGCGAYVAACPNGVAHLFIDVKLVHLSLVPLGKEERGRRTRKMVDEVEGTSGLCSLYDEYADVCPISVPLTVVAVATKERAHSLFRGKDD